MVYISPFLLTQLDAESESDFDVFELDLDDSLPIKLYIKKFLSNYSIF